MFCFTKLKSLQSVPLSLRFCSTVVGLKQCKLCNEQLSLSNFYKSTASKDKCQSYCKSCTHNIHSKSPGDFLSRLLGIAKRRNEIRNIKRGEQAEFQIDKPFLVDLYAKQNQACYYSNITLQMKPLSDWQCSLERLDPSRGYHRDNVVLSALEFNTPRQWTVAKIMQIPKLLTAPRNAIDVDYERQREQRKTRQKKMTKLLADGDHYSYCHQCRIYLLTTEFYRGHGCICKWCLRIQMKKYHNTFEGSMRQLRRDSQKNALKKSTERHPNRNNFDLTNSDILQMFKIQNQRCYISGIPLGFKSDQDWKFSLERLDNREGYVKDNCVLICQEFNSTDNSIYSDFPSSGSAQWNREKFKYFYRTRYGEKSQLSRECY